MTKVIFTLTLSIILSCGYAQIVADFENFDLSPGEYLDGSNHSGGFASGGIFLPNDYNQDYLSWLGFAISATTDTITPGFNNQYSAITGGGVDGSAAYAVRYDFAPSVIRLQPGGVPVGMYVTNSTYAYHSVRDGDAFAKKFGGESGDDPDWFRLTFKGYRDGQLTEDSIDFYLADYRFEDNGQDYIIDDWTWVDLTSLGTCDSLWIDMLSTDVGMFGMNTPAYFCLDDVTLDPVSSVRNIRTEQLSIYPNPAVDVINVPGIEPGDHVRILDSYGRIVFNSDQLAGMSSIDVSTFGPGVYSVAVEDITVIKIGQFVRL